MSKLGRLTAGTLGLILLVGVGASVAEESTSPPTNLKLVGDHWTPWDPPAAGPDSYIIKKGDTLWDLSAQWFEDPFLWPQIWDENRYILDSHWIYPGDPLVIPGRPTVVPEGELPPTAELTPSGEGDTGTGVATGEGTGEGTGAVTVQAPLPPPLTPAGDPSDLYCSGFIEKKHTPPGLYVAGNEHENVALGEGHVVFLNAGRDQGIRAGDEFSIRRRTDNVIHPTTGRDVGLFIRRVGKARVLLAHDSSATAVITMSCEDIYAGDEMVPWEPIPVPMMSSIPDIERYEPTPSGGATGRIIWEKNNLSVFAAGHVIYTDLGRLSGVNAGDFVTLYRPREDEELPRSLLGQAVILTVGPDTSSAKIMRSVKEAMLGDWVEAVR